MSGGTSHKIPGEFIGLLSDHRDFFEAIDGLYGDTGLYMRPGAADSHLDTELQDNGDLQVKLVYALDDNDQAEDGRFFVEDTFVLAPNGNFKNFERNFSLGGTLSEDHRFLTYQEKLESTTRPDQETAAAFAKTVLGGRPHPLDDLWLEGLKNNPYLGEVQAYLESQITDWELQLEHPLSSYIQVERTGEVILALNVVAQETGEGENPEAQRIFLQEKFILDAATGAFKSHHRNWQLGRFSQGDEVLQKIVQQMNQAEVTAVSSGRNFLIDLAGILNPISETKNFDKEIWSQLTAQPEYLSQIGEAAQSVYSNWTFKPKHSQSGVRVIQWPQGREILLNLWAEDAFAPGKKEVLLREHFYINPSGELMEHQREWISPSRGEGDKALPGLLKKLGKKQLPSAETVQDLINALDPLLPVPEKKVLLPQLGVREALDWVAQKNEVDFETHGVSLERSSDIPEKADPTATHQGWAFVHVLATERISKKRDSALSWLSSHSDYDGSVDTVNLQSLGERVTAQLTEYPDATLLEILAMVSAEDGVGELAQQLRRDPLVRKISLAVAESDPHFRADSLMKLATQDLWEGDLPGTAGVIAKTLSQSEMGGERANQLLSVLEGDGSVGAHLEFVGPKVLGQLGDPWMLAGMTLAPFAGVGAEAALLSRWGRIGKVATAGGILAEAATFSAVTDVGQSLHHDPAQVWGQYHWQTASTAMLFGLLRGAHYFTGRWTAKMAEGQVHPYLGGPATEWGTAVPQGFKKWLTPRPALSSYEHATVNGRILTAPTSAYHTLTPLGEALGGTLQHSSGILAMWLTHAISGSLLPHVPQQSWRGGFLDAVLGYAHAHAGFRLANGLSGGGLQSNLAQLRMGLKLYDISGYPNSLATESGRIPERVDGAKKSLTDALAQQVEKEGALPENFDFDLPLGQLIPGLFSSQARLPLKLVYLDAVNRYAIESEFFSEMKETLAKIQDPRVDALFKQIENLQIEAPSLPDEEGAVPKGEGLSQAFAILEDIMRAHETNPEDKNGLEPKFQEVNRILQNHADQNAESQNVAPRVMKIIEHMKSLAEKLGIDISPPKDMTEKIERMLERLTDQVSQQDASAVESIVDPSPEESGEFLGGLMGPDGFIGIRLNEPEKQLMDMEGEPAAIAYGVEHEGQIVITVQAYPGNSLIAKGRELPVDYLFVAEHPSFSVGGKQYRFHQPSYPSADESMVEPTEYRRPEGIDPARTGVYDPEARAVGYEAWLAFEKESAGFGIAKQVPGEIKRTRHPWVTFQLQGDGTEENLGSANFFNSPRVIIGENANNELGPGHEVFQTILEEGLLAPEQALVFLDLSGHINIVRLACAREEHSVFVDGVELEVNQPTRVYRDSIVRLRGGDGKFYNLDLQAHVQLPQDSKPKKDTFAGLSDPNTTNIDSQNVRALQEKYAPVPSVEEALARSSGITRDTFFGKPLTDPRDGTFFGPQPHLPPLPIEEHSGPLPELADMDFSQLPLEAPSVDLEPVREESVRVEITIEDEGAPPESEGSSQVIEAVEERSIAREDRFDLKDPVEEDDLMEGFENDFDLDEPSPPVENKEPEKIIELEEEEFQELDEGEAIPPPPPEPTLEQFSTPEDSAMIRLADLEAAQREYDEKTTESKLHPDLGNLLSAENDIFGPAFHKARSDLLKYPDRIILRQVRKVQGRVHDGLGVLDQIAQLVKSSEDHVNRMSTLQVLDQMIPHLHGMMTGGSQDFTIQSDGHQVRFSTFLTGETRSVGGNIGQPDGMLVLSFHADQNPDFMLQSVFYLLRQAHFPIEVIFPVDYEREGVNYIGIKYSGEHIGGVWALVKETLDKDPDFFSEERIFFSDPVYHLGNRWANVGHYAFPEGAEQSPMDALKQMMAMAWKAARDPESDNPPDPSQFRLSLYKLLREAGWLPSEK